MSTQVLPNVKTNAWAFDEDEPGYLESETVEVQIERTDPDEIALHVFVDGEGSMISFYWTRARAIEIATRLLEEAR